MTRKKGSIDKTREVLDNLLDKGFLEGSSRTFQNDGCKYATAIRPTLIGNGIINKHNVLIEPFDINETLKDISTYYKKIDTPISELKNEVEHVFTFPDISSFEDKELVAELRRRGWDIDASRTKTETI